MRLRSAAATALASGLARRGRAVALTGLAASIGLAEPTLGAQAPRRVDPNPAELAIAAGRLDAAERILFENSRRAPREPSARGALGSFLAARGRFLVGATLLEEALEFGGDSAAIESRLFDIYRWAGLFDRAAALEHSRASQVERDALARAAGTAAGGDRTATVPMAPNEAFGLGRITINVGGERVEADIQPLATGLVLPSSMQIFSAIAAVGARGDTTFGVARTIAIGGVTLGPVPVMLVPAVRTARIGLDLLGLLHPTFDVGARSLTVRAEPLAVTGRFGHVLLGFPGVSLVARVGAAPVALQSAGGRAVLRGMRWTLDVPAGVVVINP
ncbi:MAG: hypothetical protein P3A28_04555 [Gemmatimonadota bacterium]|nr:hypothetical protein [Gemmatimonadota bacterium]